MKKKLSILLAASMALSMVPATAVSAASTNKMITIPTLNKDTEYLNKATTNAPVLQIQLKDGVRFSKDEIVTITLENAEWKFDTDPGIGDTEEIKRLTEYQAEPYEAKVSKSIGTFNTNVGSIINSVANGVYTLTNSAGQVIIDTVGLDAAKKAIKSEIDKVNADDDKYGLDSTGVKVDGRSLNSIEKDANDEIYALVNSYVDKLNASSSDKTTAAELIEELRRLKTIEYNGSSYNRVGVSKVQKTESKNKVHVYIDPTIGGDPLDNGSVCDITDGDHLAQYTGKHTHGAMGSNGYIRIPMNIKATGGQVTIGITSTSGKISETSVVAAYTVSGDAVITVAEKKAFTGTLDIADIVISETKFNQIKTGEYKLDLIAPSDFILDWSDAKVKGSVIGVDGASFTEIKNEPEAGRLTFNVSKSTSNANTLGAVVISGLKIKSTRDSKIGEVNLRIKPYTTASHTVADSAIKDTTLVVGTYSDYTVTLKTDGTVPTLVTGRLSADGTEVINHSASDFDKDQKLVKVIFEETVPASWVTSRRTDFLVPEGVKIIAARVKTNGDTKYNDKGEHTETVCVNCKDHGDTWNTRGPLSLDENVLTVLGYKVDENKKAKLEMDLWVSVDAGYTEDTITVTANGPGLAEEISVVAANVVDPVTVSFETKEVKLGYQDIVLSDITIKENVAGALQNGELKIYADENLTGAQFTKGTQIEADGDIKIPKRGVTVVKGAIIVDVTRSSYKNPSTIKLTNVAITLDRTPAEGFYSLNLAGSSILENGSDSNRLPKGFFRTMSYEYEKFINIITTAPDKDGKFTTEVVLAIGSKDITVGGKTQQNAMDVAPYISPESRTMMPVRAVSTVFGAEIAWDPTTNTATVFSGERVIQLTTGEKIIYVNGVAVPMDSASVSKEERMFIPVGYLANALGVQYRWDDATKSVTFNPEDVTEASKDYNK